MSERDLISLQQQTIRTLERIIEAANRPRRIEIVRGKNGRVATARIATTEGDQGDREE
jgi:hypothetical protein